MKNNIPTETIDQIKSPILKVNTPLIISDADEVLFLFLKGFCHPYSSVSHLIRLVLSSIE